MSNRPLPTRLKLLAGNPGKEPINTREPQPRAFDEACPHWLPPYARDEWHRIVPILTACHVLSAADLGVLVQYCLAFDAMRRSVEDGGEPDYKAMQALRVCAAELGLSPASRSRVAAMKPNDGQDKAQKYFAA